MLAGAIPVILSNGWVLPFSEFLEWDAFSVRMDEVEFMNDAEAAFKILVGTIDPLCAQAMRRRAQHVALEFFSSNDAIIYGLAHVLTARGLGCVSKLPPGSVKPTAGVKKNRGEMGSLPNADARCLNLGELGRNSRESAAAKSRGLRAMGTSKIRLDVARGAPICLPPELRSNQLPERVMNAETSQRNEAQRKHRKHGRKIRRPSSRN